MPAVTFELLFKKKKAKAGEALPHTYPGTPWTHSSPLGRAERFSALSLSIWFNFTSEFIGRVKFQSFNKTQLKHCSFTVWERGTAERFFFSLFSFRKRHSLCFLEQTR